MRPGAGRAASGIRVDNDLDLSGHLSSAMEHADHTSRTVSIIVGALFLAALGYTVNVILSPFVLVGAILYLLYPFREVELARRLMWLSVFLFLIWFLYSLLALLTPFIFAFLLAYILNPVVTRLEAKKFPRWASSLVVVLLMFGIAIAGVLFVIPPAAQQFQDIIRGVAAIAEDVTARLKAGKLFEFLGSYGVDAARAQSFIGEQLSPRLEKILSTLFEALFGLVSSVSSVALHLINIIIIPFLFFYLLKDFPGLLERCALLVPLRRRQKAGEIAHRIDDVLGRYFRGAIIVAAIQGVISTIGLTIIGVNYALVLGIMTGILDFIPYVGLLISLTVSCIVALMSGDPVAAKVVAVIILFLSQKLLEAVVLGPKIIGTKVGLHPVLLILSLLVFGYFLGFVGMLIAVPTTALLLALFGDRTFRESHTQRA